MRIAGKGNFFRIDYPGYKRVSAMLPPSAMNKDNFDALKDAMDRGMTPVMSLYNPTHDGYLPANPQIGVVLLAQMTDAVLLPAAAYFHSDDLRIGQAGIKNFIRTARTHADVSVSFGTPVSLEKVDVSPLLAFLERRKLKAGGMKRPRGEKDLEWEQAALDAREVRAVLEDQARQIAGQIRSMVPESKHAASKKEAL